MMIGEDQETKIIELHKPDEPLPDSSDKNIPDIPKPKDAPIKCGFTIAAREDGSLLFDIVGTDPELTGLIGLLELARDRIMTRADVQLGGKYSHMTKRIANMDAKVNALVERVEMVVKALIKASQKKESAVLTNLTDKDPQ